jgi:hypothetical protein
MRLPGFVSEPIETVLQDSGFKRLRRGELFTRQFDDGTCAIEFVRDKYPSPPDAAMFTAKLGYVSRRLSEVFGAAPLRYVEEGEVHWFRWIGHIKPSDHDYWLWDTHADDPASVAAVVKELEDRAIPALMEHSNDRLLRDEWLVSEDPFLHPSVQIAYVAVLVRALGPAGKLSDIEARVRYLAAQGASDARAAVAFLDA